MALRDVSAQDWQMAVIDSSKPVAVEFWAPWCPWCRKLTPELEALSPAYEGRMSILKLNTEENSDIGQRYGVMGLPTIKMFCQGRPVGEVIGYLPRLRLNAELDKLLGAHRECLESSSILPK